MEREREREVKRQEGNRRNGETKGWKRRDEFKPGVYARMRVPILLIQLGLAECSFHVVEQRTRNDVDIDFTTDGLVPPLFLPPLLSLSLYLSFFFERKTLSLACSIVAKEAATRNVSFPERRLRERMMTMRREKLFKKNR